jgi:hypothetical protein
MRVAVALFGLAMSWATALLIFRSMAMAAWRGSWLVTLDFNHYGEGPAELVLMLVTLASGLYGLSLLLRRGRI